VTACPLEILKSNAQTHTIRLAFLLALALR